MTMQLCDYVWYNGVKFTLVDTEEGTSLIDSADFDVEGTCRTACYRGYTAEYFIEDGVIYGEKTVENYPAGGRLIEQNTSERMAMHYTGSLVIAANKGGGYVPAQDVADFLFCDRAMELTFADGRLTEALDLTPAVQAWKGSHRTAEDWEQEYAQREEAARAALSHEYGINYKWGG